MQFAHWTNKQKCVHSIISCLAWGESNHHKSHTPESILKRLKFQKPSDSLRVRSCLDLIEDTESSICYYLTYGLKKYTSRPNRDVGEQYLKLYGILNAVWLQAHSIVELCEIFKVPEKETIKKSLLSHQIIYLRNIAGSHTVPFKDSFPNIPEGEKKNFFRVAQSTLNAKGNDILVVDCFKNTKSFNLYNLVLDYCKIADTILYKSCVKYLNSIYNRNQNSINEILLHYEIKSFKEYNYQGLYQNDKLRQRYHRRLKKIIEEEFGLGWEDRFYKYFLDSKIDEFERIREPIRSVINDTIVNRYLKNKKI